MDSAAVVPQTFAMERSSAARLPISELQLATLVAEPPEGPEWLHEQKFDGYRILAEVDRGTVHLLSRRFKDWTLAFPTVAAAVAELPVQHALIDGEVAAVLPDGRTSFQALQNARHGRHIVYFVFDLLSVHGADLTPPATFAPVVPELWFDDRCGVDTR